MDILHTPLFATPVPQMLGVGFHNIGSEGVLRASNPDVITRIQHYYGQRCGHLPLNASTVRVLVDFPSAEICHQLAYLSTLFGKELLPITFDELRQVAQNTATHPPLVVPYINVPELENRLHREVGASSWGLPGAMTHLLKNKASFYQLADELALPGFASPDYTIASVFELVQEAMHFLTQIEELYHTTGLIGAYPLGVMIRFSEEDGNYGCCMLYENADGVTLIEDGDGEHGLYYQSWQEALTYAREHLITTMNVEKETRVVISRYIDFADSPGMSVVIMENQVQSLGWNGQLQMPGSKACVGTSTYTPKDAEVRRMQREYEEQTTSFFETLLRCAAEKCSIDFASIRGMANIDIMLPGEMERRLQQARKQPLHNYLAECNPRWTNYTDAILTVLGASHKEPTISTMREVIAHGICTIDKHPLPAGVDPQEVRACIAERDAVLKEQGTRLICRMAKNPMGLIFAGDVELAQQEMHTIVANMAPVS